VAGPIKGQRGAPTNRRKGESGRGQKFLTWMALWNMHQTGTVKMVISESEPLRMKWNLEKKLKQDWGNGGTKETPFEKGKTMNPSK